MKRGYTLTEAIIASFLLIAAILVVSRLFHASMQYSVWVENKAVATHLAEERMSELRLWATTQTAWAGPPVSNKPGFPAFTFDVRVEPHQLASPNTQLETGFPGNQRLLGPSLRKAIVEVRWGGTGGNSVKLVSILKDPPRGWRPASPVVITGTAGGTVNAGDVVLLTAKGYDAAGNEISDLFFSWSVQPVFPNGAVGTITAARDGRTAEFRTPTGPVASSGNCQVWATAVYAGEERRASSPVLNLAP